MFNLDYFKLMTIFFTAIMITCCLLNDQVTGSPVSVEKRDLHRYPRAKYRVGYMFGKRSSATPTNSILFDIISRNTITKDELKQMALKNRHLLNELATILDKNDDGYISLSDFATQETV
uniref:EF-hand domain-containing protein n=1 Tax=Arion vulgaris TaxID=1028688 RepID=A0A0B6Z931_9EUPU